MKIVAVQWCACCSPSINQRKSPFWSSPLLRDKGSCPTCSSRPSPLTWLRTGRIGLSNANSGHDHDGMRHMWNPFLEATPASSERRKKPITLDVVCQWTVCAAPSVSCFLICRARKSSYHKMSLVCSANTLATNSASRWKARRKKFYTLFWYANSHQLDQGRK